MFPSSLRSLCMRTWPNEEGAEVLDALARAADGGMRLEHLEWSGIGCRTNFYMHFEPEALGAQQSLRSLTITVPVRPPGPSARARAWCLQAGSAFSSATCGRLPGYTTVYAKSFLPASIVSFSSVTPSPSRSCGQPCLRACRSVQGACSGRCGN